MRVHIVFVLTNRFPVLVLNYSDALGLLDGVDVFSQSMVVYD